MTRRKALLQPAVQADIESAAAYLRERNYRVGRRFPRAVRETIRYLVDVPTFGASCEPCP